MSPDRHIFDDLAALGRNGEERIPSSMLDKDLAWRNLVCGNEAWYPVAADRTSEQFAELIRGILLYARASGRSIGGSVSPVIALYRVIIDRMPTWEPVSNLGSSRCERFGFGRNSLSLLPTSAS